MKTLLYTDNLWGLLKLLESFLRGVYKTIYKGNTRKKKKKFFLLWLNVFWSTKLIQHECNFCDNIYYLQYTVYHLLYSYCKSSPLFYFFFLQVKMEQTCKFRWKDWVLICNLLEKFRCLSSVIYCIFLRRWSTLL